MRSGALSIIILVAILTPCFYAIEGVDAEDSTHTVHYTNIDGIVVTFTNGTLVDNNEVQISNGILSFKAYSEKYDLSQSGIMFYSYDPETEKMDTGTNYRFTEYEEPYLSGYYSYFTIYNVYEDIEMIFTDTLEYPSDYAPDVENPDNENTTEVNDGANIIDNGFDVNLSLGILALIISILLVIICFKEYSLISKKLEDDTS